MTPHGYILQDGAVCAASLDACVAASGQAQFVWMHLDADSPETVPWLQKHGGMAEIVARALVATETRPRCEPVGGGALVNLRGLAPETEKLSDALASIRIWAERGRVISAARHELLALPIVRTKMEAGKVQDPGDLISGLAVAITEGLDPDVANLGDRLDDCELALDANRAFTLRRRIAQVRARAIGYRRFVVPERQALERLAQLDCEWLDERDRLHLSEAADRFARMAEELESVRERAALMHEQITDLRAEQIEGRSLVISVLAFIFLPLTYLTGLFGMNVRLPWQDEPWAFDAILAISLAVVVAGIGYFMRKRWFRR